VKPTDLRGILQYIPRFRDKMFVLAVDGAVVTDENFTNLLLDVAVLRSLNIRVVMVHGASAQVRELAKQQGAKPTNLDGTGITDTETLRLAMLASNQLTHEVLEGLSASDLRAVSPNAVIAHPMGIIDGVDQQLTGKVEKVDIDFLNDLLDDGIIPVLPPLGFDGEGNTYRVNSDGVALAVASALKAAKLIFITTTDGLKFGGQVIRQILVADLINAEFGGLPEIEFISSVGLLSLFPHQFSLNILGSILHALGRERLPLYGLASSLSSFSFITDYALMNRAVAALQGYLDVPPNRITFKQEFRVEQSDQVKPT